MMAKKRDDRYSNAQELLADLEAIRRGQAPVRAHQRFDLSALEELENGEAIDGEAVAAERAAAIARYQVAVVVLGVVSVLAILVIILLALRLAS